MPDEHRLTPEQKKKIAEWLQPRRSASAVCQWCGKDKFTVGDCLSATPLIEATTGGLMLGRQYPLAALVCTNCGHLMFFSAMLVPGLMPQPPAAEGQVPGV